MAVLFYVLAAIGGMFVVGSLVGTAFYIHDTLKNYSYQIKKLREDLESANMNLKIETSFSKIHEEEIRKDISELKKQMTDFHQFYYIDSEDDESLVDMVKHLHERIDRIDMNLGPIVRFQEKLSAFKWNMDYYAWNKRMEDVETSITEMENDLEKRFSEISKLSAYYNEKFDKIDDILSGMEADRINDEEKAKWLEEREESK